MKLSSVNLETLMNMTPEQKWEFVCGDIKDEGKKGEVAILLGCWPEVAIERARAAAALYHAGRVKYIVASGGVKWEYEGTMISEADLMARIMMEKGVPESAIILDNEARTTIENMICGTLALNRAIDFQKIKRVIIVTSETHMRRSMALAKALLPRKYEISAYPSYPELGKEEWLSIEDNRDSLNSCVTLIKGLVDDGFVEDMECYIPENIL